MGLNGYQHRHFFLHLCVFLYSCSYISRCLDPFLPLRCNSLHVVSQVFPTWLLLSLVHGEGWARTRRHVSTWHWPRTQITGRDSARASWLITKKRGKGTNNNMAGLPMTVIKLHDFFSTTVRYTICSITEF